MRRPAPALRTRIALFGLAVTAGVLAAFSLVIYRAIEAGLPRTQDQQLATRLDQAAAQLRTAPAAAFAAHPALVPVLPRERDEIFVVVTDPAGAPLGGTAAASPALPTEVLATVAREGAATATVTVDGLPVRVRAAAWERPDLQRSGVVAAAQAVRRQATELRGIGVAIAVSAVVTLAAAAVAVWLVTRRALRPLRDLTGTVEEVGRSGDLRRRLPPAAGDDEVARLTAGFNGMLARLEEERRRTLAALEVQQRVTADASHELRTPLATVRANAAFLREHPGAHPADRDAALADLEAEAVRMGRLVDDLLTLARADGPAGDRIARDPVDVGALATRVCARAAAAHPDRQVRCSAPPARLVGDADLLERLLWILLDNAARHTGPGGTVWVVLTAPAGGNVVLQVADDGEGLPPGDEERVFERFYQADPARRRGGAGLGLAIARWVVQAHGGTLTAGPTPGGGATFTAVLPAP